MNITAIQTLGLMIQARIPTLLTSDPGLAKTAIINALARQYDLPLLTYILSLRDPTDLLGFPYHKDGRLVYLPPDELQTLADCGEGILFLDELTTAEPRLQKAVLRLLHEGYAGMLKMPAGIAMVAAANPPETATDGYELTPPMANRILFLDWGFDWDQWARYMKSRNTGTLPKLLHVSDDWKTLIPEWSARVLGFLSGHRGLAHHLPQDEVARGGAWPSPRTWDYLSIALAAVNSAGGTEEHMILVASGLVGTGAGLSFVNWLKQSNLPDTEVLLKNPGMFKVSKDDSVNYAIVVSLAAAITQKVNKSRWDNCWKILHKLSNRGKKDIAAIAAVDLFDIGVKKKLPFPPEVVETFEVLNLARQSQS